MNTTNDTIVLYQKCSPHEGWRPATELHVDPHPFEDDRIVRLRTDEVFAFLTMRRIEVQRTRLGFCREKTITTKIELADPFDQSWRVSASVTVSDLKFAARVRIDAILSYGEDGDQGEYHDTLVIVPWHRLPVE